MAKDFICGRRSFFFAILINIIIVYNIMFDIYSTRNFMHYQNLVFFVVAIYLCMLHFKLWHVSFLLKFSARMIDVCMNNHRFKG